MSRCPALFLLTLFGLLALGGQAQELRIRPAADPAFAAMPGGVRIVDAPIINRRQMSGAVYYVRHEDGQPCLVTLRFRSVGLNGQLRDGQPANLVLRVFTPADRTLLAATIGQADEGVYDVTLDLSDQPAGRYRFSLTGWFADAELATEPTRDIGVIGAPNLGLPAPTTRYLLAPPDCVDWRIGLLTKAAGQSVTVFAPSGEQVGMLKAEPSPTLYTGRYSWLDLPAMPGVWRLEYQGDGVSLLAVDRVPGILWPSPESAAIPDFEMLDGRRIDHAWQRPLQAYLSSLTAADLALPDIALPAVNFDRLSNGDLQVLQQVSGWENGLMTGISLLGNQIAEPGHPALGLFMDDPSTPAEFGLNPDDPADIHQLYYVKALIGLHDAHLAGFNPWYRRPELLRRALAGLCQVLLMTPERQHIDRDFVRLKWLGYICETLVPQLPDDLRQPILDGMLEVVSRDGYFDGYQSNQGLNVLIGVYGVGQATGDRTLQRWYSRWMAAFLADQFVDTNHGQTPSGVYQESGSLDGMYNSYSAQLMIDLWRMTGDDRLRASIAKNQDLLRYLTLTTADDRLVSPRSWNTRTDSMVFHWHNVRAGAAIPEVATVIRRKDSHRYTQDRERIIESLRKTWGMMPAPELTTAKKWGRGGKEADFAVSIAPGLPLGCEEAGDLARRFGERFAVMRRGPWYSVFYSGDAWCHTAPGSGLAALWHADLGPLVLADGKTRHKEDAPEPPDHPVSVTDTWTQDGTRLSTEYWHGDLSLDAAAFTVSVAMRPRRGAGGLRRDYLLDGTRFLARWPSDQPQRDGQQLILPLVSGPAVSLMALDVDGLLVAPDAIGDSLISGWRWTAGEARATLHYAQPSRTTVLSTAEPCAPAVLTVIAVDLAGGSPDWWVD